MDYHEQLNHLCTMQELSLSTKYKVWGGVYGYQSVDFGVRILPGLVRTLKAEKDDSGIFIEYNMKPIYTKNSKGQRVRIGTPGEPFNAPVVAKIYPEDNPYYNPETKEYQAYRAFSIRKLTESECLRLMDVPDDLILKLKNDSGLSKSAIYKLAGNSIVCACLRRIFEQIYFGEMTYGAQFDLFSVHQGFHAPMPSVINLVTLCSGYDSQAIALGQFCEEHDANYDLLAWAEFDPESKKPLEQQPAVIAHNTPLPAMGRPKPRRYDKD